MAYALKETKKGLERNQKETRKGPLKDVLLGFRGEKPIFVTDYQSVFRRESL